MTMRIRGKFIGILGIVFLNVIVIVVMSLFAMAELQRYQTTAERGTEVITRSRAMFTLMKDLSLTAFAPETYGRLKDVFYYEKFDTTLHNWEEAVDGFHQAFGDFMNDPTIRQMAKSDTLVNDEFSTANTMSDKAFGRLNAVKDGFRKLATSNILTQEDYYLRIVTSSDLEISGLFSEVRITAYYLKNNFESFMNHFVNAINQRIESTRSAITWFFLGITVLSVVVSLILSFLFGNRIVRNVATIQGGMADISRGDFSHRIQVSSRDELSELATSINTLADALKANIDRLLHVTRDIGSGIDAETDLEAIRHIIVATAGRETRADGVALLPRYGGVLGEMPPVCSGILVQNTNLAVLANALDTLAVDQAHFFCLGADEHSPPFSSIMVCPMPVPSGTHGRLVTVTAWDTVAFTDLDFILLQSYADFAALSIENYLKYRELIELREAEYQSLQARIQPHFLYNVLNGLIGLNRMGEKAAIEAAVLDLKALLRYTLDHERTVTLAGELSFVSKYLDLQKLRFGERFDYTIECDPACSQLLIPKLLIQPLAENALIHGIETKAQPGHLSISAVSGEQQSVHVVIRDNGEGFDPATRDATKRIGLSNVIKRLELAYPGSVFRIDSAPGQGCTVDILIKSEGGRL